MSGREKNDKKEIRRKGEEIRKKKKKRSKKLRFSEILKEKRREKE